MYRTEPIQIAYADDHAIVRKGICELLNSLGTCHVAIEADNGQELIEKMEKSEKAIDICMLDIFMPVLNGFDSVTAIRERWPEMRILVLTGHNTDYYLIKMIMAGANGYLLKNCSPKELENALLAIHENGIYHSDIMSSRFFRSVMKKEIKLPTITEKETEFLKYCCSDMSYMQIAGKMGVTVKSVDWYRESLFKKLNVASRSGLVICAIQFGLMPLQIDTTGNTI
jgi:DNA-binding NarL/FixJ family response regulator